MDFNFNELDDVGTGGQIANNPQSGMARATSEVSLRSEQSAEGTLVPSVPKIFYQPEDEPKEPKYNKGNFSTLGRKRQVSRYSLKSGFLIRTLGQKPTIYPEIPLILMFQKCEF